MFGKRYELFKIFGFAINIDLSWFVIAALVTWSLAANVFPAFYPDLSTTIYWWMGVAGALGLFASVVLHELAHALTARQYGLPMRGITLFIFGGVAEMADEPSHAKTEFMVAIAGPIASILISILCYGGSVVAWVGGWPTPVLGVLSYLAMINLALVVFNLIPAFPLDGGRVLRSALWHWKDNLRWATRVSSQIGSGFGLALIALGVFAVIAGEFVGGMWYFLIGLFLRNAAQMSYQQLLLRRVLEGEPVRRFMQTNPVTVSRSISVRELVEDYIFRYHFKMFPVEDGGRLLGCVTMKQIKGLPREEWERQSVGAIAEGCTEENTISPDEDALAALGKMSRNGSSRLLVVEGDRLVGILSLKDLLKFFSVKVELEEAG